jgi:hypothetical protein
MNLWRTLAIAAAGAAAGALCAWLVSAGLRPPEGTGCTVSATREVAFSTPNDRVTAEARGPACDKLAAVLTIRAADGVLLWTYAAPADWLAPDMLGAGATRTAAVNAMADWAQVSAQTTAEFAPWPEAAPGAYVTSDMRTPFDREGYEDIRARKLPVLCFATGAQTTGMAQLIYDAGL